MCLVTQFMYGLFYVSNTLAGLIMGIISTVNGAGPEMIIGQGLWLIVVLPLGCYNALLIMSLCTHLEHPVSMHVFFVFFGGGCFL
jgi:hypothetical protein